MKLDYSILADRADRMRDGRLLVYGGDIDSIIASSLPAVAQFSLAAKLIVGSEEQPHDHKFLLEITPPDGNRRIVTEGILDATHSDGNSTRQEGVGLIVSIALTATKAGRYQIHLTVDGEEVKTHFIDVKILGA